MCGIFFELLYKGQSIITDDRLLQRINNRGPDCIHKVVIDIDNGVKASFCGAVLWMQGPEVTSQPLENDQGILLYNGDIFDETWDKGVSDTALIMHKLCRHKDKHKVIEELKLLKGPFSIIYYDKNSNRLRLYGELYGYC